jgi:hypothetical protein
MATTLSFNVSTKKYQGTTSPSATIYARLYDPAGNLILDKSVLGNAFITASTTSALYNLPLDTSSNVLQGAYTFEYSTVAGMGSGVTTDVYNYLGVDITCQEFNVTNDCNFYPNGQITATDTTNYGDWTVSSKSIKLYFPNGLSPAPIAPYIETTTASTLVVNTLATGMWTAILTANLTITQDDGLVVVAVLTKTLNHNVACNSQLCSVNSALDQITAAYAADVACGSTTPRYAQELTLANAYYTQYQIERSCGDTLAAATYADKITALVGQSSTSCGSSCGCSGSSCTCDTSCGCNGENVTPEWVNNTTSESGYRSYVALMSQTGTAAPTATILENSLGDIVWTRNTTGIYYGTLNGAFPIEKTFALSIQGGGYDTEVLNGGGGDLYNLVRLNDNQIVLSTPAGDSVFNYSPIEIRVYN